MRFVLICVALVVAALAFGGHSAAQADFCANFSNGSRNCGFRTFDQCLATISGVGGSCGAGAAPNRSGGVDPSERRRVKVREEQSDPRERRAREREPEPKAKQAAPRQEPPARPAPTTAAPAAPAPAAPPPPPVAATPAPAPSNVVRKPSPADARVYFVGLKDGAQIPTEVTVRFGLLNMGVAPAGFDNPNTGHHHLLIDTKLPPLDQPIPSDFNHLHFGAGQTEALITLPLGKHKIQLLFADENHVPHNPAVMSEPIEVTVTRSGQ